MPSAASLVLVVKLVAFVALAYYLSLRKTPTLRGIIAFLIMMTGALGFYEGFTLAVREDARARYGRVVPGKGWFGPDYLGIDQGPILLQAANHRDDFVWRYMRRAPAIRRGLMRAGFTGGWLSGSGQRG